ncbi:Ankyrin repeat protein [Nymphaea thermarum]|nr:Ankyrin repeat protein [Nymphaea thermarum]
MEEDGVRNFSMASLSGSMKRPSGSTKRPSGSSVRGRAEGKPNRCLSPDVGSENSALGCLSSGTMPALERGVNSEMGIKDGIKMSRVDWIELGRRFQNAVSSHDWLLAERLIPCADRQRLNDALCIALDSIWFLQTESDLEGVTGLIHELISCGANDFTRAVLRTSFLASCVSVCRSRVMSLTDTVNVMAQRLGERLEECNSDEILKAESAAKVQKFTEWALKCISFHSRNCGNKNRLQHGSAIEIQLQLSAFKSFLDMAGDQLTGKDFAEAFDAACFPLTLFSSAIDPCWASGVASRAMHELLGLLVEWGADNVNQCFLEASRFGSTELVRILLQIAQQNSLDIDVDLALGFASHFCKMSTMECLVEEGHASAFLGPLMRAAERGCMQVVRWFVEKGCRDMELCLALTAATSSCQIEVADYLLQHVPHNMLSTLGIEIIKAAGERSCNSLAGVAFLMQSNFLKTAEATYEVADRIVRSDDEGVTPELRAFLSKMWTKDAYHQGRKFSEDHYLNVARIIMKGTSPVRLLQLPLELQVGIAYYPLYSECIEVRGQLLPQWLRGQLVEAVWRLGNGSIDEITSRSKQDLVANLERHLPSFLIRTGSSALV